MLTTSGTVTRLPCCSYDYTGEGTLLTLLLLQVYRAVGRVSMRNNCTAQDALSIFRAREQDQENRFGQVSRTTRRAVKKTNSRSSDQATSFALNRPLRP